MKRRKLLTDFNGALGAKEAAEGMNAAARNARRLLNDAYLLLGNNRFATATSIAILSIEESSKITILRGIVGVKDPTQLKIEWRKYRDHRAKVAHWSTIDCYMEGARKAIEFTSATDPQAIHTAEVDTLKQLGFYTGKFSSDGWSEPEKVIDQKTAVATVQRAKLLCPKHDVTVRDLELWYEYVTPVVGTVKMLDGLLHWAGEMYAEGLSNRSPQEYEDFLIGDGFSPKPVS